MSGLQDFIDYIQGLEFRPIDREFLEELWPTILAVIEAPDSNPAAAVVLLAIAVTFVIIIVMAIALFIMSLGEVGEEEYEYIVVGESGSGAAGAGGSRAAAPRTMDPLRFHRAVLWGAGAIVLLLIVGGFSSQTRTTCTSCHEGAPHTAQIENDQHQDVRCTGCHESGGIVSSYTLEVPGRIGHMVVALINTNEEPTYGLVTGRACMNCHSSVLDEVVEIEGRGLLVSHEEPVAAGAGCMDCHMLDEEEKVGPTTVGMGACLRCHDGVEAAAECSTCHRGDVSEAVLVTNSHEPRQIIARPDCYTCHEPAPCDSCHGVRLPHPADYATSHMMDGARDIWFNDGRTCYKCHSTERDGPNSCYRVGCHFGELNYHRPENPGFPRNHGNDPEMLCDDCHRYAESLSDPCQMCH